MKQPTPQMLAATRRVKERIAQLQIERYGLGDTVDEYIQKSTKGSEEKTKQIIGRSTK
jgi:hypothetical protein